ncbi:MAG: gamma carbonic anhydrase family protein [Nitrosopumilus sp.]|nr:gamma carbonic anhydrase family protein [Nitrosopumilus sp.]
MSLLPFKNKVPKINSDCFIAPNSVIIGDVEIGSRTSVWFGTVLRGDVFHIKVGFNTNIQDNSVVHVTTNKYPTIIGNNVTIGHSVTLHGCSIDDNSLVGIGSIVMDECELGEWSIIAAGSVVKPNTKIPSGKLWGGLPAKEIRDIHDKEREWIKELSNNYLELSKQYLSI